jgi:hypothetical protein
MPPLTLAISLILASGTRTTVAQTTVVIAARRLMPEQLMKKGVRPFRVATMEGNIKLLQDF